MAPDSHQHEAAPPAGPEVPSPSTLACPNGAFAGTEAAPAALPGPALGDDCWILSGPTASGKTALSLLLARRLEAEIVSVDSMAVYRGLDIGTAKPTPAQRAEVPHHVVDLVGPGEIYTVARWLADAAVAVEACRSRGKRILFVGGRRSISGHSATALIRSRLRTPTFGGGWRRRCSSWEPVPSTAG